MLKFLVDIVKNQIGIQVAFIYFIMLAPEKIMNKRALGFHAGINKHWHCNFICAVNYLSSRAVFSYPRIYFIGRASVSALYHIGYFILIYKNRIPPKFPVIAE